MYPVKLHIQVHVSAADDDGKKGHIKIHIKKKNADFF